MVCLSSKSLDHLSLCLVLLLFLGLKVNALKTSMLTHVTTLRVLLSSFHRFPLDVPIHLNASRFSQDREYRTTPFLVHSCRLAHFFLSLLLTLNTTLNFFFYNHLFILNHVGRGAFGKHFHHSTGSYSHKRSPLLSTGRDSRQKSDVKNESTLHTRLFCSHELVAYKERFHGCRRWSSTN